MTNQELVDQITLAPSSNLRHESHTWFRLPTDEAFKLVAGGKAVVAADYEHPPLGIMRVFLDRLPADETLGPSSIEANALSKLNQVLFRDGLRQAVAENVFVEWIEGLAALEKCVSFRVSGACNERANPFLQTRLLFEEYLDQCPRTLRSIDRLSTEAQQRNSVVPKPFGRTYSTDDFGTYIVVGASWRRLYEVNLQIDAALSDMIQAGIETGRVLVSETTNAGDRMLPPSIVHSRGWRKNRSKYFFCLSSDLPGTWFSTLRSLPAQKKRAATWMIETHAHFHKSGKRASVKDLKTVAAEKFKLSNNAIDEAWRDADIGPLGSGNISEGSRVSISEIRGLI